MSTRSPGPGSSRFRLAIQRADIARATRRRIVRALLITLLIGFFAVRYAIRRYYRTELIHRY